MTNPINRAVTDDLRRMAANSKASDAWVTIMALPNYDAELVAEIWAERLLDARRENPHLDECDIAAEAAVGFCDAYLARAGEEADSVREDEREEEQRDEENLDGALNDIDPPVFDIELFEATTAKIYASLDDLDNGRRPDGLRRTFNDLFTVLDSFMTPSEDEARLREAAEIGIKIGMARASRLSEKRHKRRAGAGPFGSGDK